jgi:hypothetical protein
MVDFRRFNSDRTQTIWLGKRTAAPTAAHDAACNEKASAALASEEKTMIDYSKGRSALLIAQCYFCSRFKKSACR